MKYLSSKKFMMIPINKKASIFDCLHEKLPFNMIETSSSEKRDKKNNGNSP